MTTNTTTRKKSALEETCQQLFTVCILPAASVGGVFAIAGLLMGAVGW